jgi:predicted DNA-binding transcriptional regulator AlpA
MDNKLSFDIDIKPLIEKFESIEKGILELKKLILNKEEEPELITRNEFLDTFHKSPVWLWQHMKDGDIPYIRIGRAIHFNKSEVIAYFKNKTNEFNS